MAASHAPRSVRARLFAAEQKKQQKKKKGAAGGQGAEKNADDADDLFSRATLDPFASDPSPAKLRNGSHTLSGPDFGVVFREPEAAEAAAAAAAEAELQQRARSDAAAAARADAARRMGKADLPKQKKKNSSGAAAAASHVLRASRALFQPQQK